MTDLSGLTPAEQVRALGLAVGDTIEGRDDGADGTQWREYRIKLAGTIECRPLWECWQRTHILPDRWMYMGFSRKFSLRCIGNWRKISSDPSIDPSEPLRRELREAFQVIRNLRKHIGNPNVHKESWHADCIRAGADTWLARNAAFRAGKEESE